MEYKQIREVNHSTVPLSAEYFSLIFVFVFLIISFSYAFAGTVRSIIWAYAKHHRLFRFWDWLVASGNMLSSCIVKILKITNFLSPLQMFSNQTGDLMLGRWRELASLYLLSEMNAQKVQSLLIFQHAGSHRRSVEGSCWKQDRLELQCSWPAESLLDVLLGHFVLTFKSRTVWNTGLRMLRLLRKKC